jgi:hypothetical protein
MSDFTISINFLSHSPTFFSFSSAPIPYSFRTSTLDALRMSQNERNFYRIALLYFFFFVLFFLLLFLHAIINLMQKKNFKKNRVWQTENYMSHVCFLLFVNQMGSFIEKSSFPPLRASDRTSFYANIFMERWG